MNHLVFLKLGGSLITDKDQPHQARIDQIDLMANEVKIALNTDPELKLLIGHGSGSFGHVPAKRYNTRQGVHTSQEWRGFAEVWAEAHALNQIVVERFLKAGLPVISFPPSAAVSSKEGKVADWNLEPIARALETHLLPLVFGDVIFDRVRGGTILSTEELFAHLAQKLMPQRILIAGEEPGVWEDYPNCTRIIPLITRRSYPVLSTKIFGSSSKDVTGGMASKVAEMVALVRSNPHVEVLIFSPKEPGALSNCLAGFSQGTLIKDQE